jgi:tetratricopeptide (TPR) repeat protein
MTGKLKVLSPVIAVFALTLFVISCGSDDENKGAVALSADELVQVGWDRFEAADYFSAANNFQQATALNGTHSDAWNGAGWANGRIQGKLDEAIDCFARAYYSIDTTRYDALGGLAFATYQAGDWQNAIDKADSLLQRRPGWRFLHESTLDFNDVWLLIARSYYNLGDFSNSLSIIRLHLNLTFEADITTELGRMELLSEIERLGQIYG